jgi:hypothetical protein
MLLETASILGSDRQRVMLQLFHDGLEDLLESLLVEVRVRAYWNSEGTTNLVDVAIGSHDAGLE